MVEVKLALRVQTELMAELEQLIIDAPLGDDLVELRRARVACHCGAPLPATARRGKEVEPSRFSWSVVVESCVCGRQAIVINDGLVVSEPPKPRPRFDAEDPFWTKVQFFHDGHVRTVKTACPECGATSLLARPAAGGAQQVEGPEKSGFLEYFQVAVSCSTAGCHLNRLAGAPRERQEIIGGYSNTAL